MSSGTINDGNRIGNAADGFNSKPDAVNAGSKLPEGVTAQSNGNSTSPVTSGATASSQVSPLAVKETFSRVITGSHGVGNHVENESVDFATDKFKSQAGPRGETTNTPNAGA
jgi:hypothetical protein